MKKRNDALMDSLALHLATGGKLAPWAVKHNVGERTAREWAALPEFVALRQAHQRVIAERILGRHFHLASRSMVKLKDLLESPNETVRQRAVEFTLNSLVNMSNWVTLEKRLVEVEKRLVEGEVK